MNEKNSDRLAEEMTKREAMALNILHGLLSGPDIAGSFDGLAETSVKIADFLLQKLEPTSNE